MNFVASPFGLLHKNREKLVSVVNEQTKACESLYTWQAHQHSGMIHGLKMAAGVAGGVVVCVPAIIDGAIGCADRDDSKVSRYWVLNLYQVFCTFCTRANLPLKKR